MSHTNWKAPPTLLSNTHGRRNGYAFNRKKEKLEKEARLKGIKKKKKKLSEIKKIEFQVKARNTRERSFKDKNNFQREVRTCLVCLPFIIITKTDIS